MRNYSLPPYNLGEIGYAIKRISKQLNIECKLCGIPGLKEKGGYSIPTLSEDIVKIASNYGESWSITGNLAQTGVQLQQLIDMLATHGINISVD